jgi:hypothetical protein
LICVNSERVVSYAFLYPAALPASVYFARRIDFYQKIQCRARFVRSLGVLSASEATTCHKRKRAEELEKIEKTVEQSMENARSLIDRFFEVFQKTMNPWSGTALVDQMQRFAVKNVHASFEFVA